MIFEKGKTSSGLLDLKLIHLFLVRNKTLVETQQNTFNCLFTRNLSFHEEAAQHRSLPGCLSNKAVLWFQYVNGLLEGLTLLLDSFQFLSLSLLLPFHLSISL